ncbi:MAG: 3-phosphoshikimate 1-carboxyvinyltransferase [Gemmatimonadaceae bacterium]
MAPLTVAGRLKVPGDKSISHRSLILASLADGESRITGILDSEDVRSTAGVLRAMGAQIPELSQEMLVRGSGLRGLRPPKGPLDCGNSGTTTRLVAGVVAGHPFSARFEGDASLSRRPMKRIAEPLAYMGARFVFEGGDGLPMTVHGVELRSIDWDTKTASAQVKSAILLAGLVSQVEVRVTESGRSRDHTEKMLRAMGVDVENDGNQVCLKPSRKLNAVDIVVPSDPSSAAFFIAAAALAREGELRLEDVCLNPTRIGFIEAIRRMGGNIVAASSLSAAGEEIGTLTVRPSLLGDLSVTEAEVPSLIDELPLLACVAAAAGVELEVTGASELRVKESDRISAVVQNLRAVGVSADEMPDGLRVRRARAATAAARKFSGVVDPRGDHRIAMAFGVLSAVSGNQIRILDPEIVAVSYPRFWEDLRRVVS